MIGDHLRPSDRLRCLRPECWSWKLAMVLIAAAIVLALMLEARASDMPPFNIGDPMCNTGFTISQRLDTRNAAGTITKSVWVRKCAKTPRVIYKRS